VEARAQPALEFGGIGATDHLLTPRSNRAIQVIHAVVEPGGNSGEAGGYPTPTEAQFVHVLKGEFELTLDGRAFRMKAGDSLTFTGREPRAWRNPSATRAAEVLWMMTPSLFG
jgi:quercetin dioxygenase-like cupin family protein